MLRKLSLFLVLTFTFFVFPGKVFADQEFDIASNTAFDVRENGITRVSQIVTIKNKTEFIYTPTYSVTLGFKNLSNLKTFNQDGLIENSLKDTNDGKTIELTFPKKIVGEGQANKFTISYETRDIAKNKKNLWEISIPGLSNPNDFTSYDIKLSVPQSFGKPSISKPSKNLGASPFIFDKNDIGKSGILIIFGEAQTYELDLTYNITNTKVIPVKTEIAIPPPTSYQEARINEITPLPLDVYEDSDGNWLAVYNLSSRETKRIKVKGVYRVYGKPIFETETPQDLLGSSKYWDVNDPGIKELSLKLKTPRAIYDYVVNTLSYNFDKVSKDNIRLGARGAIKSPDFAVCLEFTDLFVALARSAGIKARSLEGYAYTDNDRLRPLSLVRDVLHSWPEYFDETTKSWVMIDPTWGNTTHGVDYFSSFDYDHITFAIKGASSTYPVPAGGYKLTQDSKDVAVNIVDNKAFTDVVKSQVSSRFPDYMLSGIPVSGEVTVNNLGNMPIKNKKVLVESDLVRGAVEFYIDIIPPFGKKVIPIDFPKTRFLTNRTYEIKILFDGNTIVKNIQVGLFPSYFWILVGGIVSVSSIIIAIITYKTWRLYIQRRKE